MICQNSKCQKNHDGTFATGRFCCRKCARSFSTSKNREEINKKVSDTFKEKGIRPHKGGHTTESREKALTTIRKKCNDLYNSKTWNELSYEQKKRRLIEEEGNSCKLCGLTDWKNLPITLRFDHIDGNRFNNERSNCRLLCPNCDSQLDTYCGKNKSKSKNPTDEEFKKSLKDNNFVINKVLTEFNLSPGRKIYSKLNTLKN